MALLIIGAGGHGRVVAEIAEDCGYENIAFLDDNNEIAIGKIADIEKYAGRYQYACVGIGNNKLRSELISRMEKIGYKLPALIHPTAYVSKSAIIGESTVVEPSAIINANAVVGKGCIISLGAIVDHDAIIENYVHVNAGAIVGAGVGIQSYTKLESGKVIEVR